MDDRVSLIEHKTLASMKVTVESRAHTVQRDLKKRAEDLDSRHPPWLDFFARTRILWQILCLDLGPLCKPLE